MFLGILEKGGLNSKLQQETTTTKKTPLPSLLSVFTEKFNAFIGVVSTLYRGRISIFHFYLLGLCFLLPCIIHLTHLLFQRFFVVITPIRR